MSTTTSPATSTEPTVGQMVKINVPASRHDGEWFEVKCLYRNSRGTWVFVDLPETQTHVACEGVFHVREIRWS